MKKGLTEVVFILDRSGSMAGLEKDTIGGFNAMLEKQRRGEGQALISTVLFSNESAVIHDRVDARDVPPLTEKTGDVRMVQFEANRAMLSHYAKKARDCGFSGLFAQISDPVDPLARAVFLDSNQDERGNFDRNGLLPEQVQGYGLGVMHARAQYYAKKAGLDADAIRAYGPHGTGLIVANAPGAGYDDALSKTLTEQAATANLRVRELGFKPYLAPGLSSACVSVLKTLRGE